MHEISLVENMMEVVRRVATDHKMLEVRVIRLELGPLLQVQPELFDAAFQALREGTAMSQARLEITRQEIILGCSQCQQEFTKESHGFACPHCGSFLTEIRQGRDLIIQSIEGE
ncbi:MAG TPA: hydrogenase maturation nickel metallochaperone HypA [Bacteroidales bacterium]|nr:hydrogenase maturation nickel metallochaperone HypA [Bacteroidales bacterium]